jgi:purine-binding chemotaxis protein CheW
MSTATVTHAKENGTSALVEVCSVRLEKTWFGVPISHILEIVGGARPQPVPLAPGYVGGLLNMPPKDGPQDIIVLESKGGCFGLLVDAVGEVLTLSAVDFEQNPSTLDARRRALLAGAYKLKDKLLVMLDPERLDPIRLSSAQPS